MKVNKILVPVDFSEYSDKAVDHALLLAEKFGADIFLLHVITLFESEPDDLSKLLEYTELVEKIEAKTYRKLRDISRAKENDKVRIEAIRERSVSAPEKILEVAKEREVDMIVMGTHGRSGLKKWVYGSVAEKVVRFSPVPVITVQNSLGKFSIEKILVPVDYSKYAAEAVKAAIAFASEFGAKIEFLHVVNQAIHPSYYIAGVDSLFAVNHNLKSITLEKLKGFVGAAGSVEFEHTVLEGDPADEIVRYAKETKSDLIIMATRGLTGFDHLLLGSTAERVIRLAKPPVLTVRPFKNEEKEEDPLESDLSELVSAEPELLDFWDRNSR